MTIQQAALEALVDEFAHCAAKAHAESLYGTSKGYTAECRRHESEARANLMAALQQPQGVQSPAEAHGVTVADILAEFDRRAAPGTGFYEPEEPAQIIRAMLAKSQAQPKGTVPAGFEQVALPSGSFGWRYAVEESAKLLRTIDRNGGLESGGESYPNALNVHDMAQRLDSLLKLAAPQQAQASQSPAPAHANDRWTIISPQGNAFTGETPFRAANEANKHVRATDPAEAKKFADMLERLRAENEAENARLLAEHGTLNCPTCGGSGHIGDVVASLRERLKPTGGQS